MKSKSTQDIFRNVDKASEELPELTEQFFVTSKEQHGGPNRNQGRKLGPWGKRRLLSIKCTPAEFARIKKRLSVRARAEAMLEAVEKNEQD